MIVDSSELMALLLAEPGSDQLLAAIAGATAPRVPAPMMVETGIVISFRTGPDGVTDLLDLVDRTRMRVLPFTEAHARGAVEAFLRYGKGRHPARLNFGDCMAYAVAKAEGAPLLFVGGDFGRTDVVAAGQ